MPIKKVEVIGGALCILAFVLICIGAYMEFLMLTITGLAVMVGACVFSLIFYRCPHCGKCRCEIKGLLAVFAGYATKEGFQGADYWLMKYKKLPEYYLAKQEAKERGWIPIQGNLSEVAPDNDDWRRYLSEQKWTSSCC